MDFEEICRTVEGFFMAGLLGRFVRSWKSSNFLAKTFLGLPPATSLLSTVRKAGLSLITTESPGPLNPCLFQPLPSWVFRIKATWKWGRLMELLTLSAPCLLTSSAVTRKLEKNSNDPQTCHYAWRMKGWSYSPGKENCVSLTWGSVPARWSIAVVWLLLFLWMVCSPSAWAVISIWLGLRWPGLMYLHLPSLEPSFIFCRMRIMPSEC